MVENVVEHSKFVDIMPPKIIHLCWFSKDSYPLEIKICLASWKRVLPDYKVRVWTYEDAKAIVVNI